MARRWKRGGARRYFNNAKTFISGGARRGYRKTGGIFSGVKRFVHKHPMLFLGLAVIGVLVSVAVIKFSKASNIKPIDFVKSNLKMDGKK